MDNDYVNHLFGSVQLVLTEKDEKGKKGSSQPAMNLSSGRFRPPRL